MNIKLLLPYSLQPDGVNRYCFYMLSIRIHSLKYQRSTTLDCKDLSLWQKLNSFIIKCKGVEFLPKTLIFLSLYLCNSMS